MQAGLEQVLNLRLHIRKRSFPWGSRFSSCSWPLLDCLLLARTVQACPDREQRLSLWGGYPLLSLQDPRIGRRRRRQRRIRGSEGACEAGARVKTGMTGAGTCNGTSGGMSRTKLKRCVVAALLPGNGSNPCLMLSARSWARSFWDLPFHPAYTGPPSSASLELTDHSQVDVLGLRYKSITLERKEPRLARLVSPNRMAPQKALRGGIPDPYLEPLTRA